MTKKDRFASEAARGRERAEMLRVGIDTKGFGVDVPVNVERARALRALEGAQQAAMRAYGQKAAPYIQPSDPAYWEKLHGAIRDRGGVTNEEFRDQMGEELKQAQTGRTTSYTDPFWHDRLENMALVLLGIIERDLSGMPPFAQKHPEPGEILLGTAPGFEVNGRVIRVPSSEYRLILIDETLFLFSFLWTQVMASAQPVKGEGKFDLNPERQLAYLRDNPVISENVKSLFRAYALDGGVRHFRGFPWDLERREMVRVDVTVTQLFVIAHELVHCFQPSDDAWEPLEGAERAPISWQREFHADYFGLELAILAGMKRGCQPAIVVGAVLSFFHGLILLDATIDTLKGTKGGFSRGPLTHPSHASRYHILRRNVVPSLLDANNASIAEALAARKAQLVANLGGLSPPESGRM